MAGASAALLLPGPVDRFNLRDQARDLARSPGVRLVEPERVRYGAIARLPGPARSAAARLAARSLGRRLPGNLGVLVAFHAVQWPVVQALARTRPGCEVWYCRWDRYERAYDAGPRRRAALEDLHESLAERADLIWCVSDELARLEAEAGREAVVCPPAADAFPAPDPDGQVVAVSLGHLGWRNDWRLLRGVLDAMPELTLLLIGARHDGETPDDPDLAALSASRRCVWFGPLSDEAASRVIACADVGIVPFRVEPFNDAGLPNRILKYARLGRRTLTPPLAGTRTWSRATVECEGAGEWVAALRAEAGRRAEPDRELRAWAFEQTAERSDAPLWERLLGLGVPGPAEAGPAESGPAESSPAT